MKKFETEVDACKIDSHGDCRREAAMRLRQEGGWQLISVVVDGHDPMIHHFYWSRELKEAPRK